MDDNKTRRPERNERFRFLLKHLKIKQSHIAKATGYTQGFISELVSDRRTLTDNVIDRITETYQHVNGLWLLSGEGEMLLPHSGAEMLVANEPQVEYVGHPARSSPGGIMEEILDRLERVETRLSYMANQLERIEQMFTRSEDIEGQ